MMEMATKDRITKVSRVFLRVYAYTARVEEGLPLCRQLRERLARNLGP